MKKSTYYKEVLALHVALQQFSHFIWGAEKPRIVLTDKKNFSSFFQSKSLHPTVWNFIDRVIAYTIVLAHIPRKVKAAAYFLSRMQTGPNESLKLQLVGSIPIKQMEIDLKPKTPDISMLTIESIEEIER